MHGNPRFAAGRSVVLLTAALTPGGCDGAGSGSRTAVVDTPAGGAVRVVNASEGLWSATGADPWALVEDLRIGVVEGDPAYGFGRCATSFRPTRVVSGWSIPRPRS